MPGPLRPHLDLPQKSKTALTDGFKIFSPLPKAFDEVWPATRSLGEMWPATRSLGEVWPATRSVAKGGASKVLRRLSPARLATLRVLAPFAAKIKNVF